MKSAGPYTLAALASSQFYKAELFDIALANGITLRLTDYDLPLTVLGNVYLSNAVIKRGTIDQQVGLGVKSLSLDISPQDDAVTPLTVSGLPATEAVRLGMFDRARVRMYKVFMQSPGAGQLPTNTHDEAVLWWSGIVAEADSSRMAIHLSADSDLQGLNVQMPRNVIQTGCTHSLFDPGCTLAQASYTTAGAVSATGPNSIASFTTNLSAADGYFALGIVTFTSGANAGFSRTVKAYANAGGTLTMIGPLPNVPATGDAFTIIPGCDKTVATCRAKFSVDNSLHFGGAPWVPVPETLYDGGTVAGPAPVIGRQGIPGAGSLFPGHLRGIYKP